jgi:hypothetical protein
MITPASTSPSSTAFGIWSNITGIRTASGHSSCSSSAAVVSGPGIATRLPRSESSERGSRATTTGP